MNERASLCTLLSSAYVLTRLSSLSFLSPTPLQPCRSLPLSSLSPPQSTTLIPTPYLPSQTCPANLHSNPGGPPKATISTTCPGPNRIEKIAPTKRLTRTQRKVLGNSDYTFHPVFALANDGKTVLCTGYNQDREIYYPQEQVARNKEEFRKEIRARNERIRRDIERAEERRKQRELKKKQK